MKSVITKLERFSKEQLLFNEWLITNGLGGYACGTLSGTLTRKYHSLLTAALPNPYGRTIVLNYVAETLLLPDQSEIPLSFLRNDLHEEKDFLAPSEFYLKNGLPVWIYNIQGVILEKSYLLIHRQNTLHASYKLRSGQEGISLKWRPYFHFRTSEEAVNRELSEEKYILHAHEFQYEIECPGFPPLRLYNVSKTTFAMQSEVLSNIYYQLEAERGYAAYGPLSSPGYFQTPLIPKKRVTFIVSTESWNTLLTLSPEEAWSTENLRKNGLLKAAPGAKKAPLFTNLVLAADQFIMTPRTRFEDMLRLQAAGEEVRSIIAGYPWFTDWGRDTMISLEGLTLTTGRHREAYAILHTFAHYIKDGLIPNMFPDGENKGIYNTADATLWFFHAINRYVEVTGDDEILEFLAPKLESIIQKHINGTSFGIKMDSDALLIQGYPGVQLTWMDAKVGEWVVTPRRGKAVEINALWYNALKLYEKWTKREPDLSARCYDSFNQKFWYEEGEYLYDIIEGEKGNDPALRPNQLFAISLDNPILAETHWKTVLERVQKELYTPVGLRTLSPSHPDYKENYHGDLKTRDAAYHQGSVWPWLLGPYIDAWLKVYPDDFQSVHEILKGLEAHLYNECIGSLGEIFDASPPFKARGCFAQAWSVAEMLRCYARILPHIS